MEQGVEIDTIRRVIPKVRVLWSDYRNKGKIEGIIPLSVKKRIF